MYFFSRSHRIELYQQRGLTLINFLMALTSLLIIQSLALYWLNFLSLKHQKNKNLSLIQSKTEQ